MLLMTLLMSYPLSALLIGQINDACNRSSTEERPKFDQVHLKMYTFWNAAQTSRLHAV
jgi:hypothetical protein